MNIKIIIPACIILLVIVVGFNMAGGSHKITIDWNAVSPKTDITDSVVLNVYVENSGSMDGYMCPGSNLKDAVFDYVSDMSKYCDTTSLFYVNSKVIPYQMPLKDYILNLTPTSFKHAGGDRSNTDLPRIFDMIMQNQTLNTVTVFVSDCILDIPHNAQNFFGICQVSMKNLFNNALDKYPDLGLEIIKLQSKFDGYWYCGQNKELLTNVKRPYYIWVIGDKYILARINKEVPYDEIIGGIDKYCAFSRPNVIPFHIAKNKYVVPSTNKIRIDILADFMSSLQSEDILTDCNNYTTNNPIQVKIESVKRITSASSKYSHIIRAELDNPKTLTSETITIRYPEIPTWVKDTNDDSGDNITSNIDRTTGLLYLITGASEAFRSSTPKCEMSFRLRKN